MTVHLVIDSALGDLLLAGEEPGSTGGGCVPHRCRRRAGRTL